MDSKKTLVQDKASFEHKLALWLHHGARPAWTPGKDLPAMHQLQEHPLPYVCGAVSVPRCSVDLAGTPRCCQVTVGCLGSPRVARGSTRWGHCCVLLHTGILSPVGSVDQKQILIALTVHLEKVFPLILHFPNRFVCVFSKGAEIRQLVICSIF